MRLLAKNSFGRSLTRRATLPVSRYRRFRQGRPVTRYVDPAKRRAEGFFAKHIERPGLNRIKAATQFFEGVSLHPTGIDRRSRRKHT